VVKERRGKIGKLGRKFEIFSAITFAEAGETATDAKRR